MTPERVSWLVFFATFAGILAPYLFSVARRARRRDALRRRLGTHELQASLLLDADGEETSSIDKLVTESGLGWTRGVFIFRTILVAAMAAVAGAVLGGGGLAFLFGMCGLIVVPVVVSRARAQRLAQCDAQMPQALEIMSLALRAGHPLPRALAIAAGEAPAPIADELTRAVEEHDLGRPVGEVLLAFGRRLEGCEAVNTFVVAVLVLQQTGGNLIQVIERIVENARARAQYQGRVRALTAEGRSSATMLAMMPLAFGLLAAWMDPSYGKTLLGDPRGNVVLGITLALWLLGILWTRKLVSTES